MSGGAGLVARGIEFKEEYSMSSVPLFYYAEKLQAKSKRFDFV